ncbi:MAG TPA: helix-turn-helix domain-containing protein, partial [Propionibacteriaceae bacterium]
MADQPIAEQSLTGASSVEPMLSAKAPDEPVSVTRDGRSVVLTGAPEAPEGDWAPRRALDQLSILHEAVRFIDEHGVQNLTMRRLGSRLGVEAMALYRYIPGREQLLDGVVEVVMDELY